MINYFLNSKATNQPCRQLSALPARSSLREFFLGLVSPWRDHWDVVHLQVVKLFFKINAWTYRHKACQVHIFHSTSAARKDLSGRPSCNCYLDSWGIITWWNLSAQNLHAGEDMSEKDMFVIYVPGWFPPFATTSGLWLVLLQILHVCDTITGPIITPSWFRPFPALSLTAPNVFFRLRVTKDDQQGVSSIDKRGMLSVG